MLIESSEDIKALRNVGIVVLLMIGVMVALIVISLVLS